MGRKAIVAMSGGVDSSVSAALLVEEGYDVTGIMLKLWRGGAENTNSGCCNLGAAEDARRVADKLGIPFFVFNFAERFENSVIKDFKDNYLAGRTPNPCVRCNQWIKFDMLMERARGLGADVLATGHYARVDESAGRYRLSRGADPRKDQSYVLWMLTQEQLAHVRFPVGEMNKTETRAIAAELGLRTAAKPDSQEICFVRSGEVGSFVGGRTGDIVDAAGNVVGRHRGVANHTVGQRKGLGISLGVPVYVTGVDAASNTVVVGSREELGIRSIFLEEVSFTGAPPPDGRPVLVQHRAHGDVFPALLRRSEGNAEVVYDRPIEAVAPGQSAVLYDGDEVLGGGIIARTLGAAAVA